MCLLEVSAKVTSGSHLLLCLHDFTLNKVIHTLQGVLSACSVAFVKHGSDLCKHNKLSSICKKDRFFFVLLFTRHGFKYTETNYIIIMIYFGDCFIKA